MNIESKPIEIFINYDKWDWEHIRDDIFISHITINGIDWEVFAKITEKYGYRIYEILEANEQLNFILN